MANNAKRLSADPKRSQLKDALRKASLTTGPSLDREYLGRLVRLVWIAWAQEQSNPNPSWLKPWEEIPEEVREVDRRIGAAIAQAATLALLANVQDIPWLMKGYHDDCQRNTASAAMHYRAFKETADAAKVENERLRQSLPDDIRAAGWSVAVHNDYRQDGVAHTLAVH
jgi:hypothetical protein